MSILLNKDTKVINSRHPGAGRGPEAAAGLGSGPKVFWRQGDD